MIKKLHLSLIWLGLLLQLTCILGFNERNEKGCLVKFGGQIEDCDCDVEQIDKFNNYHLFPLINELLKMDYFRYFKVNLYKICTFWPDDARCSLKDCSVKTCDDDDLPHAYKKYFKNDDLGKITSEGSTPSCEQSNPLGHLNDTITEENLKTFEDWKKYDDAQDNFCEPDDEYLQKAKYVDLVVNPERYTAYKGPHAHKIWNSIYNENCFKESIQMSYMDLQNGNRESCFEKRVFYRLVSGLHTSINVHLSARYLHKGIQENYWAPSNNEFCNKFDPEKTNGLGPQWLKNLYFIYLVELRAIVKASPYLEKEMFYTGNTNIDSDTKTIVLNVLNKLKSFSCHFDESKMFKGDPNEAKVLKAEFQQKFRNITKIMDCVGCDKCRLWGKLQTQALGTALKILFSGKKFGYGSTIETDSKQIFQLSRAEIVSLLNGFGRLSTSISEIDKFKNLSLR